MWVYHHLDYHQQVEILRRCTAEALADPEFIWEQEFVWDKEREALLLQGFRALRGITEIAHGLNCPEPDIMRKILELGLYERFGELEAVPGDTHAARIAQLRSETALFDKPPVVWSDVQENALFWLFCAGEDITEIALTLNAPETVVLQQILDRGFYRTLTGFSLFEYCSDWNRRTFKAG